MKKKWHKTPKYILRESVLRSIIRKWRPANFIEFGPGTGNLTKMLLDFGFHGKCYDIGDQNRVILRNNLEQYQDKIEVLDDLSNLEKAHYDYLFAFAVLQVIKNDSEVLKNWATYLKQDGKILIAIPAHKKKFHENDRIAGTIRRYEKKEVINLLKENGFKDIKILNYGFPLGNITRIIGKIIQKDEKKYRDLSQQEKAIKSGIESTDTINKFSFLINGITLLPFILLQYLFLCCDWGDDYIAYATKI